MAYFEMVRGCAPIYNLDLIAGSLLMHSFSFRHFVVRVPLSKMSAYTVFTMGYISAVTLPKPPDHIFYLYHGSSSFFSLRFLGDFNRVDTATYTYYSQNCMDIDSDICRNNTFLSMPHPSPALWMRKIFEPCVLHAMLRQALPSTRPYLLIFTSCFTYLLHPTSLSVYVN